MGGALSTSVDIALNSLVLGGVFLIVAVGLNIIYGLSRVMNLAHGSLYAIGAYTGYTLVATGLNYFAAIVIAPIIVGVVGLILERTVIAPMRKRSMLYTLILTYGLMFFLDGLVKHTWGNEPRFIQLPDFMRETLPILGTHYPVFRLATLFMIAALHDRTDALFEQDQDRAHPARFEHHSGDGVLLGDQHELCPHRRLRSGVHDGRGGRHHRRSADDHRPPDGP